MQARTKNQALIVAGALEHRNLDRHGDSWRPPRDRVAGAGRWAPYLQRSGDSFGSDG